MINDREERTILVHRQRVTPAKDRWTVLAASLAVIVPIALWNKISNSDASRLLMVICIAVLGVYSLNAFLLAGKKLWSLTADTVSIEWSRIGEDVVRIERDNLAKVLVSNAYVGVDGNNVTFEMKDGSRKTLWYLESEVFRDIMHVLRTEWQVLVIGDR